MSELHTPAPPVRVRASVLIERPIAAVFAYLSRPDYLPRWVSGIAAAEGSPPSAEG